MPTKIHLAAAKINAAKRELARSPDRLDPATKKNVVTLLRDVLLDVRRNIREPIPLNDITAIQRFLRNMIDFLSALPGGDSISEDSIVSTCSDTLGMAGRYSELATHYFDERVVEERRKRPTNEVDIEVDAISKKSSDFKKKFISLIEDLQAQFN